MMAGKVREVAEIIWRRKVEVFCVCQRPCGRSARLQILDKGSKLYYDDVVRKRI